MDLWEVKATRVKRLGVYSSDIAWNLILQQFWKDGIFKKFLFLFYVHKIYLNWFLHKTIIELD